jgi:uncharacterized protein YbjT (DUF2867 family)
MKEKPMPELMENGNRGGGRLVTVFGGSGFLGRRIVKRLLERNYSVRAVSRHPERMRRRFSSQLEAPEAIKADVLDAAQVSAAIAGSYAVVNAVSLYVQNAERTFERVHVKAAADLASASIQSGVRQFVQISGIGADTRSTSPYIKARGRGEEVVRNAFSGALVVRPAVMTGPDDAFLTTLVRLVRLLPVYPLFGDGSTRLQPVYVEDVAEGLARLIEEGSDGNSHTFEFGGPRVFTYRELLQEIARQVDTSVKLVPMPFAVWKALAAVAELLPGAPLTRNQVELMREDNVTRTGMRGLAELGIKPMDIDHVIRMIERNK